MIISYVSTTMDEEDFAQLFTDKKTMPGQQGPKFNRLLMEGLVANDIEVHACIGRPVTRENCARKFLPSIKHVKSDKFVYLYGSILNLPIVKNIWQMMVSYSAVCREARKGSAAVICDVLNASIALGASAAAKHKRIPCIGIVTDLPELMVTGVNQKHVKIVESIINKCTGYVFLTEAMNEKLNQSHKPYVIIEGLCDVNMIRFEKKSVGRKAVRKYMYAGFLDSRYGVKRMVDGFVLADLLNVELHIYGDGPYAAELMRVSQEHPNVVYHGTVMNDVVIQAELEADLLINPRPTHEEFTKYSFPSKNIEYMATGTPVLTTELPGMPEEYKQYVYLLQDETEEGIATALKNMAALSADELCAKGIAAKKFVLKEKNNITQAGKLISVLRAQ